MAVYSDMNGFPESGFPVLANENDMICLNTLNLNPLKANNYQIDVLGNCRFSGAVVMGGALSGVTSLSMGGALSGVTTIGANNTVTLSSATAPLTLSGASAVLSMTGENAVFSMTGLSASIGTLLQRIRRAFFTDLEVTNVPTVSGEPVALISDLQYLKSQKIRVGGLTDYSEFEADGTLKFNGGATVWVDIDFPLIIRTIAAGRPTYATVLGNLTMPKWAVNDWCEGDSQEVIHAVKEGSTGYFHVHILTAVSDASDRYIRFELEFNYANIGAAWNGTNYANTPADLLIPANTPIRSHLVFNIHTWSNIGNIGRHMKTYVKRVAAAGAAPSVDPFCEMLQLHVECDTLGSRDITAK